MPPRLPPPTPICPPSMRIWNRRRATRRSSSGCSRTAARRISAGSWTNSPGCSQAACTTPRRHRPRRRRCWATWISVGTARGPAGCGRRSSSPSSGTPWRISSGACDRPMPGCWSGPIPAAGDNTPILRRARWLAPSATRSSSVSYGGRLISWSARMRRPRASIFRRLTFWSISICRGTRPRSSSASAGSIASANCMSTSTFKICVIWARSRRSSTIGCSTVWAV